MKKILASFAVFLLSLIFCSDVKANILINEFSSGTTSDWVELYNNATTSADLSTYKLMDSGTNEKDLTGSIAGGGFATFDFSNRLDNSTHDGVRLYDGSTLVDSIFYGDSNQVCFAGASESIGRYPDGGNTIDRFATPTKNSSNNSATLAPCPAPTVTPTQSPTQAPTAAPTAAPTTSPTKSPTPIPTKKPTPWPSATPDPNYVDESNNSADVLGLRDSLAPSDTPKAQSGGEKGPSFPLIAGIFIVVGLGLMGGAGYMAYKKQKQNSPDIINE